MLMDEMMASTVSQFSNYRKVAFYYLILGKLVARMGLLAERQKKIMLHLSINGDFHLPEILLSRLLLPFRGLSGLGQPLPGMQVVNCILFLNSELVQMSLHCQVMRPTAPGSRFSVALFVDCILYDLGLFPVTVDHYQHLQDIFR